MNPRLSTSVVRSCLTLTAFAFAPLLHAATPAAGDTTPGTSSIFAMNTTVIDPTRDFRYQPEGVSSSSAAAADDLSSSLDAERDSLADGAQPAPGRRRSYGRSRYQDRMHNADGSTKIAFVAGAGLNLPTGNTGKFYTPSYTITAGAGINFNKTLGILGEFHYDHMGLTSNSLNYQYANYVTYAGATADDLAGLDGNAHVIALTVNPIVNFSGASRGSKLGGYVTGGVGFYHKVTNFTLPQEIDTYYYSYITPQTFDSYSANSFGVNGGFGLTYKLSEFSSERLFVEARYNWLKISANNSGDFFPFNRRNTGYIPITAGIRF
ncbi:MAG: hypothetical protein ACRYGF_00455 [Janthinobacterium lividum]